MDNVGIVVDDFAAAIAHRAELVGELFYVRSLEGIIVALGEELS